MAKKGERKEALFKILVFIISGIILNAWAYLIAITCTLNWIGTLISGKRNKDLAEFSEYFNTELYKFSRYLTGVSNKRPFPFSKLERMSRFG